MVASSKSIGLVLAVLYLRMSSKKQDKSIAAQRTELEKFAAANGYRIIREYKDEGISGSESDKREDFKRLIKDAQERRDFKVILCWDQDRFSRFDPMEANHYWYILREVGVEIVTVAQGRLNFEDLAGWLTASVNQYGKAQFLRDLSRNSVRGKHKALQEGKWIGKAPYAYAKTDKRLVLGDSDEVKVVKWLYEQYAETDTSARAIQLALNERGTPGPAGEPWASRTILNILRNPVYKGQAVSNRQNKGKFFVISNGDVKAVGEQNGHLKPESDWIISPCPAIVSETTWEIVQDKLVKRRVRRTPKRGGGDFLLSGLIHCGDCGSRMVAMKQKGRNTYVCGGYQKFGLKHCHANTVPEDVLVDRLVETICDEMMRPENMKALRGEIRRQVDGRRKDSPVSSPARWRKELKRVEEEILATLKELKRTPDDLYPLMVEDLRKLREQKATLENRTKERSKAQERTAEAPEEIVERVAARLQTLRGTIRKADPAIARQALAQFCSGIKLFFEHTKTGKSGKAMKLTRSRLEKGVISLQLGGSNLRPHS